ncbi:DUF4351 domain-containing protein [Skermanella stibiiresistens]|nr:DUF4351 domain-containing protein [Skermanella stibiiresistens]
MVRYIMVEGDETDAAMVRDMLREVTPNQETKVMGSALDAYKAEWKAEGIEIGVAEGIEIGVAKGQAKGMTKGKTELLTRLLIRRFGPLPDAALDRLASASDDQLNAWAESVLDAPSLDAVFGERRAN